MVRMSKASGNASSPAKKATIDQKLRSVPYRNEAMQISRHADGTVLASVPMKRPKYLVPPISWILPFSESRRVELDAIGAGVLDLCDGDRTVENVIERFAQQNKLTFREAQLSVMRFLGELTQRGMVVLVGLDGVRSGSRAKNRNG